MAVIAAAHVALFTLAYYGRRRGLPLCESDWFLFGVPLLVAAIAYGALFTRMLPLAKQWHKITLASLCAALLATASAVAGMSVAFTMMGT